MAQAQGTPYQKPKTPRIWPTIFRVGANFFLFFTIQFYFIFPLRGEGAWPPWPPPPWLRPWGLTGSRFIAVDIFQLFFFQRSQKHPCDWSPEDLISSIKHGTPRHSPVDVDVAARKDGGMRLLGLEFWEGFPLRNRDF